MNPGGPFIGFVICILNPAFQVKPSFVDVAYLNTISPSQIGLLINHGRKRPLISQEANDFALHSLPFTSHTRVRPYGSSVVDIQRVSIQSTCHRAPSLTLEISSCRQLAYLEYGDALWYCPFFFRRWWVMLKDRNS